MNIVCVCNIYYLQLTGLLEAHSTEVGVTRQCKEHLVLSDTPYTPGNFQGHKNSEYDCFDNKDMKKRLRAFKIHDVIEPGSPGHFFVVFWNFIVGIEI